MSTWRFVRFHAVWEEVPRISVPFSFTRDELAAVLDWDVAEHTSLGVGYRLRTMDREFREVEDSDEDVFELDRPGQLLPIRVGRKQTSAAPYYIRNQAEIDRLLGALVALRGDRRD